MDGVCLKRFFLALLLCGCYDPAMVNISNVICHANQYIVGIVAVIFCK